MTARSRQIASEIASDEERNRWENAREQAQAQFESIREMVEELQAADAASWDSAAPRDGNYDERCEAARERIQEDALSVEVRSDWYVPGSGRRVVAPRCEDASAPAEYRIVLCTGGPAVQITGQLNEHCEPETARLEMQDWFLSWTEYRPEDNAKGAETGHTELIADAEEILLAYARQFYFGE